jgi:hypothetical protein
MFSFLYFLKETSGEFGGKNVQLQVPFRLPSDDPEFVMGVYVKGDTLESKVKLLRYIKKSEKDKKYKEPQEKDPTKRNYWEWKYAPFLGD